MNERLVISWSVPDVLQNYSAFHCILSNAASFRLIAGVEEAM